MKIAILCARFPYPLEKGDKLRMYYQIKYLSKNHDIHLICINETLPSEPDLNEIKKFTKSVKVHLISKAKSKRNAIVSLMKGMPMQVGYFYERKISNKIEKEIGEINPDVIYCQLVRMAEYCKSLPYPKVLDYMDAFAKSMQKRQEIVSFPLNYVYRLEAKLLQKYEAKIYKYFDKHTIITEQDRLSINLPDPIQILPNGIETDYFKARNKEKPIYNIAFIGNMNYLPNIEAAEYIVNQLLPKLRLVNPEIKVLLAGAEPHVRIKKLASKEVTVSGWIEDIRDAYQSAKIFVAPLFSGTGQQNKILEAMSMGIPVITTMQVNKGILAKEGDQIFTANNVEEFLKYYQYIYENPPAAANITANARNYVLENYSWDSAVEKLEKVLEDTI